MRMGWKKFKEAYRISHIVSMKDGDLVIGSPYIWDLIIVGPNGVIKKHRDGTENENLMRYEREIGDDPVKAAALIAEPDVFEKSIPIYTYENGEIIKKYCERRRVIDCASYH